MAVPPSRMQIESDEAPASLVHDPLNAFPTTADLGASIRCRRLDTCNDTRLWSRKMRTHVATVAVPCLRHPLTHPHSPTRSSHVTNSSSASRYADSNGGE